MIQIRLSLGQLIPASLKRADDLILAEVEFVVSDELMFLLLSLHHSLLLLLFVVVLQCLYLRIHLLCKQHVHVSELLLVVLERKGKQLKLLWLDLALSFFLLLLLLFLNLKKFPLKPLLRFEVSLLLHEIVDSPLHIVHRLRKLSALHLILHAVPHLLIIVLHLQQL